MAVNVMIPTALRSYAEDTESVSIEGDSAVEVLKNLTERFPKLRPHLFSDDGQLRNFVNVFVNGEGIRFQEGADRPVGDGDATSETSDGSGGSATGSTGDDTTGAGGRR